MNHDTENGVVLGDDEYMMIAQHHEALEDEAIARAVAASLLTDTTTSEDMLMATRLQQEEEIVADQELVTALHESEQQANEEDDLYEAMTTSAIKWKQVRSEERNQGAWDCTQCTLTNPPYQTKCSACRVQAPPSILTFHEMPPIRFGLEIEMLISNGERDGFTLETMAQELTKIGPPSVVFRGYTHEVTHDEWKIVTDASISLNQSQDLSFELVSPILSGQAGLTSLRSVMENVRRLGIFTNASCGFHVHVDAEATSPVGSLSALKRISRCFVSLENAFDLLVGLSWDSNASDRRANSNRYCRSNLLAFGEKSSRQRWKEISAAQSKAQLVDMMNPSGDRYRKLNLTNITKPSRPSTCEFRHHGGVEDLQEAEAWVRLLLLFCQNAAERECVACLLPEGAAPKTEIRALFDLVGCQGLEQYFVVERKLFVEQRLCNEWECRVCSRTFANSRSLSQHSLACGH